MKTVVNVLQKCNLVCTRSYAWRAVARLNYAIDCNAISVNKKSNLALLSSTNFVPAQQSRRFCEHPEANSFHVQDYEDFKERVLNSQTPVVVDFFADWCGPCKLLAPRLESMVDRKSGRVILAKVNVDDNTELAMEYGVRSVPTVIAFKDGQPVDQMVGLTEDEQITSFLNKLTNE